MTFKFQTLWISSHYHTDAVPWTLEPQLKLSEQLELLHQLDYCDNWIPLYQGHTIAHRSYLRDSEKRTTAELGILDTVALMLTSGLPGDATSVVLEKKGNLCLILAKAGVPTLEDDAVAHQFFDLLADPKTKTPIDMFPYLHSNRLTNINSFITYLRQSLTDFKNTVQIRSDSKPLTDLQFVLSEYTRPGSEALKGELSQAFAAEGEKDSFGETVHRLVDGCIEASVPLDPCDVDVALQQYSKLMAAAESLLNSYILNIGTSRFVEVNLRKRVGDLSSCLVSICKYFSGMKSLIRRVKRWFPDGQVPFRWVSDKLRDSGEGQISLPEYIDVLERTIENPPSSQTLDELRGTIPNFGTQWGGSVRTYVHPEVRMILSLGEKDLSREEDMSWVNPTSATFKPPLRPMGCSTKSCLCCSLWIEAYNFEFRTAWCTSAYRGVPDSSWALPALPSIGGPDRRSAVGGAILEGIRFRLTETLCFRFPHQTRTPSEETQHDPIDDEDWQDAFSRTVVNLPRPFREL